MFVALVVSVARYLMFWGWDLSVTSASSMPNGPAVLWPWQ